MLNATHEGSENQLGRDRSSVYADGYHDHLDSSEGQYGSSFATHTSSSFVNDKRSDEDYTDYDEPNACNSKPKAKLSILDFFGGLNRQADENNALSQLADSKLTNKTSQPAESIEQSSQVVAQMGTQAMNLTDLEQKFYTEKIKRVTPKEFLASFGPKIRQKQHTEPEPEPQPQVTNDELIVVSDTRSESEPISLLESKIYNEVKSMSARDFLMQRKKQREYFAVIKLASDRLREIEESKVKKSLCVTLNIEPAKLKQLNNPLFSRGTRTISGAETGTNANLIFQVMMKRAAVNEPRLTLLQKLKELEPPVIPRDHWHVTDDTSSAKLIDLGLQLRSHVLVDSLDGEFFDGLHSLIIEEPRRVQRYRIQYSSATELLNYVTKSVPLAIQYPPLTRILHRITRNYNSDTNNELNVVDLTDDHNPSVFDSTLLWTEQFAPLNSSEILVLPPQQEHLRSWISTTLNKLKSQTTVNHFKRRKRDSFDDFIDDTDIDDEDPTYPIMILVGPHGSGKSSSVYAVAKEFDGYVHEVNTGQARSKKDIFTNIKEIATTHLVHGSNKEGKGDFKKVLLLFEDCDILFEQDKTFWSVIYEAMELTRRPIILTCHDRSMIPNNILLLAQEAGAILDFGKARQANLLKDYVWLCGVSRGFDLDRSVLDKLDCNDIRLALMSTQVLCNDNEKKDIQDIALMRITLETEKLATKDHSLEAIASELDALSVSDYIEVNTKSQLPHTALENEFVDQNLIDETSLLSLPTLPYELNCGKELHNFIPTKRSVAHPSINFGQLRRMADAFVASRSKKLAPSIQELLLVRDGPRNTRSLTRSPYELTPEPVGVDEGSISYELANGTYATDFLSFVHAWALFQISLDKAEADLLQSQGVSVKRFLRWRQFQIDPWSILPLVLTQGTINI